MHIKYTHTFGRAFIISRRVCANKEQQSLRNIRLITWRNAHFNNREPLDDNREIGTLVCLLKTPLTYARPFYPHAEFLVGMYSEFILCVFLEGTPANIKIGFIA